MTDQKQSGPTAEDIKEWINRASDRYSKSFDAIKDVSAKAGDEALRFIGLAQLGGIAGCLGFIGAVKHGSKPICWALVAFTVGIAALLAAHLIRYLNLVRLGRFIVGQAVVFAKQPTPQTYWRLQEEAHTRDAKFIDWSVVAALVSGFLFFLGAGFAGYAAYVEPAIQPTVTVSASASHSVSLQPSAISVASGASAPSK
jgi:hypothetical protein